MERLNFISERLNLRLDRKRPPHLHDLWEEIDEKERPYCQDRRLFITIPSTGDTSYSILSNPRKRRRKTINYGRPIKKDSIIGVHEQRQQSCSETTKTAYIFSTCDSVEWLYENPVYSYIDGLLETKHTLPNTESPAMSEDHIKKSSESRLQEGNLSRRSASPAKRSAAAMEGLEEEAIVSRVRDAKSPIDTTMTELTNIAHADGVDATDDLDLVELDARVDEVMKLMTTTIEAEEKGYLVSYRWLDRVFAKSQKTQSLRQYQKSDVEAKIGPIDNSDIVVAGAFTNSHLKFDKSNTPFIRLKPEKEREQDFEILPEAAWQLIISWYGLEAGQAPIVRYAKDTAEEGTNQHNIVYELFPPVFTIRKVLSPSSGSRSPSPHQEDFQINAIQLVASREDRFQDFLKRCKKLAKIPMEHKVRPWRQLRSENEQTIAGGDQGILMPNAAASRNDSPQSTLVLPQKVFAELSEGTDIENVDVQDNTTNANYNGKMTLNTLGLNHDQTLVLEEQIRGPAGGEFTSDMKRNTQKQKEVLQSRTVDANTKNIAGPITRSRNNQQTKARGRIGLTNLGNTCYMNSALQCISRIEELAQYFLSNYWHEEINSDNPLGYHGKMAKAYADFLLGLYQVGANSAYTPRNFKSTLAGAQPMFSGYGQQDSQEFLSFLVDALHEDLNRIHQKPYRENPDSNDARVHDPEYIKELGNIYRDNHRARNDSIAMDLFNGFYKNTMVCPECDKISITFDPYSLLTLQLPIENVWEHTVVYISISGNVSAHKVDLEKTSSVRSFKQYFAKRIGNITADQLLVVETFQNRIYKVYGDGESIGDIAENDEIFVYELSQAPTNVLKQSNATVDFDMNSAIADCMVFPVIQRGHENLNKWTNKFPPMIVLITRNEAKDMQAIQKKIIQSVAKYTTRDILTELREDASQGKTTATSPITEDDYVDVSMNDDSGEPSSDVHRPSLQKFFETCCDIKYYSTRTLDFGQSTGMGSPDINVMANRVVRASSRRNSVVSINSSKSVDSNRSATDRSESSRRSSSASAVDEVDEIAAHSRSQSQSQHHFAGDVQSDEESTSGMIMEPSPVPPRSTKKSRDQRNNRKNNQYSSKNRKQKPRVNDRTRHVQQYSNDVRVPSSLDENEIYYVKLGDVILLDWSKDGQDALYSTSGTQSNGHLVSLNTMTMEVTYDAEYQSRQSRRIRRKKDGVSLEDCFAETAKTETLSEENAWYCARCKELRRADKTLMIWTAPDILVLHLKRFSGERYRRDKVDVLVDFPLEGLDLSDRVGCQEDGKQYIYDLFAVDNHYGGLGGGHYTAFGKNFVDGKWYDFNGQF